MPAIQLLHLFTVAGAAGDTFNTPWMPFPTDYDRAEYWVECKMFTGATVTFKLQSSMDMDETNAQEPASTAVTAKGTTVTDITTKLGAYARLNIAISTGDTHAVVSIWVMPKRS